MSNKKRKSKPKTKVIYREKKESVDYEAKAKKEIEELNEKKKQAQEGKSGIGKFFAGVGYTKEINERRRLVSQSNNLQRLKKQAEIERVKSDISKIRGERVNFNKTSGIKFDDLFQ